MIEINEKNVKKLNGKKLSTIIEKYGFRIDGFLNIDEKYGELYAEMQIEDYKLLKNKKVTVEILKDDWNFNFLINVDRFEFFGVFD